MIQIKTAAEIELMRAAGLVVGHTLELLKAAVEPGMTTQDLDDVAARSIRDAGAVPSFLGYHGFPGTICTSVNDEIVHGIPSPSKVLREGDIVSIDCGAIVEGYHGDAAVTVPVGRVTPELTELMRVCEGSMWAGFAAARLGGRLSDIGAAVERHVWPHGYGVVEELSLIHISEPTRLRRISYAVFCLKKKKKTKKKRTTTQTTKQRKKTSKKQKRQNTKK